MNNIYVCEKIFQRVPFLYFLNFILKDKNGIKFCVKVNNFEF